VQAQPVGLCYLVYEGMTCLDHSGLDFVSARPSPAAPWRRRASAP